MGTRRCSCLTLIVVIGSGCSGCVPGSPPPPAAIPARPAVPMPVLPQTSVPIPPDAAPPLAIVPNPTTNAALPVRPWKPDKPARDWKYVVIHHTASTRGSVESIHETHLQRKDKHGNPWQGIGYHFVIGNGQGMDDGEIESTFRWREQIHGAHAGDAEYNQKGIGVCLVGNFEETSPSPKQLAAVKRLVSALKADYHITADRVVGHGRVKATACPGRYFPLDEISLSVPDVRFGAFDPAPHASTILFAESPRSPQP